ncbi:MAG: tetratricopeptide repeat protein [Rhodobacteraceae bacterium]|nr:tetratricopeptide repeat protein [Paracoccaceae bacterium]
MHHDRSGAPIALTESASATHWDAMTAAFLAHGRSTPDHLAAVIAAEPELALPIAVKGLFCVMLGRREMTEAATGAARDARRLMDAGPDCPRTRHFLEALDRWLAGDPPGAIAALETQLTACPSDTLAAKIVHGMRFMIGDAEGMLRSVERVLPAHGPDHPYRGYLLGCRAFALEETGTYCAAETSGRDGLVLARDDAWGLHAVAHVHDMTHRPAEGIALIEAHPESWEGCNNFRYHVWWHKALLHLDRGEIAVVLDLYDRRIRADQTDDYRDIANATSLLMRLELEGAAVGDRWDELAALAESRCEDGELIFADLHYMLALMGGAHSDSAARLERCIAKRAGTGTPMGAVADDPGRAAAAGLAAFGEGRYDAAFRNLSVAMQGLQRIGGSHAQRDVFERMTIDAGLRAGQFDAAEDMLNARAAKRAGALDSFADTRLARISAARTTRMSIPAQ